MARWVIHRPHEHCHASEIRVAEMLKDLDDRWTILWGYFYRDEHGNDREGDFLVLGPAGGLLVLEVKSSIPCWFAETGQWEGEAGSPVDQLMSEWSAVRRMLKKAGSGMWVTKVLCIPGEVASRETPTFQGISRPLLDLRNGLDARLRIWLDLLRDKVPSRFFLRSATGCSPSSGPASSRPLAAASSTTPSRCSSASSRRSSPCSTSSATTASFWSGAAPGPARPDTPWSRPSAMLARATGGASCSSSTTSRSPPSSSAWSPCAISTAVKS